MTLATMIRAWHSPRPVEWVKAWSYGGGKRDLRIDLLRGVAVFSMIVGHIGGWSSWLNPITGGNAFIVSSAEPFVFISGLVMGMV